MMSVVYVCSAAAAEQARAEMGLGSLSVRLVDQSGGEYFGGNAWVPHGGSVPADVAVMEQESDDPEARVAHWRYVLDLLGLQEVVCGSP